MIGYKKSDYHIINFGSRFCYFNDTM